jgi:predicted DNA binding protein
MAISIGDYIRQKLRSKNISNREAGETIGISESAFEKILRQQEIYASRLVKLSTLLEENLFDYYYDIEPIKAFRQKEVEGWQLKVDLLSEKLTEKERRLLDQEDVIRLLKEKEQFLTSRS